MMRIKALFIVFFLFLVQLAIAQHTYSNIVTDTEIYDFLNWMTNNDKKMAAKFQKENNKVSAKILPWESANFKNKYEDKYDIGTLEGDNKYLFKRSSGLDTLFTDADKEFIQAQFQAIQDSVWHKSMNSRKMVSAEKSTEESELNYYSIPLFSVNKEYVIIHKAYTCGYGCAYGKYYLYKYDKNRWRFVMTVNPWTS